MFSDKHMPLKMWTSQNALEVGQSTRGNKKDLPNSEILALWTLGKEVNVVSRACRHQRYLQDSLTHHCTSGAFLKERILPDSYSESGSSLAPQKTASPFVTLSPHLLPQGTLFLNDRQCKIVQRQLEFDGGIAYGIDCLLMDPSLGGRCDSFFTVDIMVSPSVSAILSFTKDTAHGPNPACRRTWVNALSSFGTSKIRFHHFRLPSPVLCFYHTCWRQALGLSHFLLS